MIKLHQFKVYSALLALFVFMALPALAQEPIGREQQTGQQISHQKEMNPENMRPMDKMMQQMTLMMDKSSQMMQQMQGKSGMGMMQGNLNWMNMVQDTDKMVKNLNQVLKQMQSLIKDKSIMSNPQMREHLLAMRNNMESMMDPMNELLNNAEKIQKVQEVIPQQKK
jgi:hypothetical protein